MTLREVVLDALAANGGEGWDGLRRRRVLWQALVAKAKEYERRMKWNSTRAARMTATEVMQRWGWR